MNNASHIILDKELRLDIDAIIQRLKAASINPQRVATTHPSMRSSRERSNVITKLQEAVMWLDEDIAQIKL